jgi:hypothetical protein
MSAGNGSVGGRVRAGEHPANNVADVRSRYAAVVLAAALGMAACGSGATDASEPTTTTNTTIDEPTTTLPRTTTTDRPLPTPAPTTTDAPPAPTTSELPPPSTEPELDPLSAADVAVAYLEGHYQRYVDTSIAPDAPYAVPLDPAWAAQRAEFYANNRAAGVRYALPDGANPDDPIVVFQGVTVVSETPIDAVVDVRVCAIFETFDPAGNNVAPGPDGVVRTVRLYRESAEAPWIVFGYTFVDQPSC